jgi:hypothetical protein
VRVHRCQIGHELLPLHRKLLFKLFYRVKSQACRDRLGGTANDREQGTSNEPSLASSRDCIVFRRSGAARMPAAGLKLIRLTLVGGDPFKNKSVFHVTGTP